MRGRVELLADAHQRTAWGGEWGKDMRFERTPRRVAFWGVRARARPGRPMPAGRPSSAPCARHVALSVRPKWAGEVRGVSIAVSKPRRCKLIVDTRRGIEVVGLAVRPKDAQIWFLRARNSEFDHCARHRL